MVKRVRNGKSQRTVAREFGVSLHTVQRWIERARGLALEEVDWFDHPHVPQRIANKTAAHLERKICRIRKKLEKDGSLGFSGALSIHGVLQGARDVGSIPSVRTIGRILKRHGFLDRPRRMRNAAPPPGWYLSGLAGRSVDLDCFDVVEDLRMDGFGLFQVFTARTLWAPLAEAWPGKVASTTFVIEALQAHWRRNGLPKYAQFDNDVRFQGGHNHPDVIGRVMRLCLALGVTPVFVPPLEMGFQGIIENFNGLWQQKVWSRFHHENLETLTAKSQSFTLAYRQHLARTREGYPARRPFPNNFNIDWQQQPTGVLIYLRRTNEQGVVKLLGHSWEIDPLWQHRLVRSEVDLDANQISFYRLRRREPSNQPLIKNIEYKLPQRRFDTRPRRHHILTPIR
jgi:putative transposase